MPATVVTRLDVLREARRILSKRGAWTQHTHARDSNNTELLPEHESAVCFCAVGSLYRAIFNIGPDIVAWEQLALVEAAWNLLDRHGQTASDRRNNGVFGLQPWNDVKSRKKKQVVSLFDGAILQQERRELLNPRRKEQ